MKETISNEEGNNEILMESFTKNAHKINKKLRIEKLMIKKSIIVL